jgi:ER membrane protein complex subunit 1
MIRGYTMPFESSTHGVITHVSYIYVSQWYLSLRYIKAALDAAHPNPNVIIGRFVLTTSTGSVLVWQHDRLQWTREEALSEVEIAAMVDLPEKQSALAHTSDGSETFFERVRKQFIDAKVSLSFLRFQLYFIKTHISDSGLPVVYSFFYQTVRDWFL